MLVVLGGPLVLSAGAYAVARSIAGELPDPVATHWGVAGPDGFGSRDAALLLTLLGLPLGALLGGGVALLAGRPPGFRRLGGGLALGLAGFVDVLALGSLWVQRGLEDARDAPDLGVVMVLALVSGVFLGALGAWLTPGVDRAAAVARDPVPAGAPRVRGRAARSWTRRTTAGRWAPVVVLAIVGVTVVLVVVGIASVFLGLVGVLLAALVAGMTSFRVTVDEDGLAVVSTVGVPRFVVPLDEVVVASVEEARPLRQYGGWGVRAGAGGRYGVVLRAGSALAVRRGDGTTFVVTVDGAAEAAALLNTLADAARTPRRR